jgi:TPR repeat protein
VAKNYAPSESNLGFMYLQGRGVASDNKEAAKLFRKAAQKGYAAAEYNLGLLYYTGAGVRRDYAEAMKLFRSAAQHGSAEAQNQIGAAYQSGTGVPVDYSKAWQWYQAAAKQGLSQAKDNLAMMAPLLVRTTRSVASPLAVGGTQTAAGLPAQSYVSREAGDPVR